MLALDRVSLTVGNGEFVALLGPSGCGKTTLLRILAGQEVATSGQVAIDGHDMSGVPRKRPIKVVPQTAGLFPAPERVRERRWPEPGGNGGREAIAKTGPEMLALVRLEGGTRSAGSPSSPADSSSGWRWRERWSTSAAVLLLDEPLGALDLKLRKAMQYELKRFNGSWA